MGKTQTGQSAAYYKYWGKAGRGDAAERYHSLPYYCLDVAALPANLRQQLVDAFSEGAGWRAGEPHKIGVGDYSLFTHAYCANADERRLATSDNTRWSVK